MQVKPVVLGYRRSFAKLGYSRSICRGKKVLVGLGTAYEEKRRVRQSRRHPDVYNVPN